MIWLILCGTIASYFIGFLVGRHYEKDYIMEGVYGVMSKIDKNTMEIASVTYYYSEDAYNAEVQELKEKGQDVQIYEEDENNE